MPRNRNSKNESEGMVLMKVKYLGGDEDVDLIPGKVYDVLSVEKEWYRIIDEDSNDDASIAPGYLYPPNMFEIVDGSNVPGDLFSDKFKSAKE